jgi:hypothetical protein
MKQASRPKDSSGTPPASGEKLQGTDVTQGTEGTPEIRLVVWHPVPSLNQVLGMNLWRKQREKLLTQGAVLCALRAFEFGCSTKTTQCPSGSRTLSGTLGRYLTTRRSGAKSKPRK